MKLGSGGALTWHTFLGASGFDAGGSIAYDDFGNVYVTGLSTATWGSGAAPQGCPGCPNRAYTAGQDGFAAKMDINGALLWNTFLGGSSNDVSVGAVVDKATGILYTGGYSSAAWGAGECGGCPVRAYTAGNDAFAAKLNSAGGLAWNTFVGGDGDEIGYGIAIDGDRNVYLSGKTDADWGGGECTGCPIRAYTGNDDAFAVKLGPPANNDFANARVIGGTDGVLTSSNVEADKETGEPYHANNPGGASVWFRWTPASSGHVGFNTIGSEIDTLLSVYTGNSVGTLTPVTSNDDCLDPASSQRLLDIRCGVRDNVSHCGGWFRRLAGICQFELVPKCTLRGQTRQAGAGDPGKECRCHQRKGKIELARCTLRLDDYQVVVKNTDTGQTVFDKVVSKSKSKTGVLPAGNYKWFVKARNEAGTTKSKAFKFSKP